MLDIDIPYTNSKRTIVYNVYDNLSIGLSIELIDR